MGTTSKAYVHFRLDVSPVVSLLNSCLIAPRPPPIISPGAPSRTWEYQYEEGPSLHMLHLVSSAGGIGLRTDIPQSGEYTVQYDIHRSNAGDDP
jgi:hypothetical protein